MDKSWFNSMTFYGCLCVLVGGGLEVLGVANAFTTGLQVIGIPIAGFGIRRALD